MTSAETLICLIKERILLGTAIITDCWVAHSALRDEGYTLFTVNLSITFVEETTGAHTNTIECTWKQVEALQSP